MKILMHSSLVRTISQPPIPLSIIVMLLEHIRGAKRFPPFNKLSFVEPYISHFVFVRRISRILTNKSHLCVYVQSIMRIGQVRVFHKYDGSRCERYVRICYPSVYFTFIFVTSVKIALLLFHRGYLMFAVYKIEFHFTE